MRILLIVLFSFFYSCKSENELEFQLNIEEYVNKNFDDYADIHRQTLLWLEESIKVKRENLKSFLYQSNFKVDRLLILNRNKNKLVGTINFRELDRKAARNDWVFMFWGVKINDVWYFTKGGNLFVPRENYKYNIYKALDHFQLSYIGRDYFLKHFLNMDGDLISVNSDLIDKHVSIRDGYKYKEDSEENWLSFFEERYTKTVPQKEIDAIWESIKNETKEDHKLPKEGTKAWKELYGTKIPLFEREEWKNYEAQLNQ